MAAQRDRAVFLIYTCIKLVFFTDNKAKFVVRNELACQPEFGAASRHPLFHILMASPNTARLNCHSNTVFSEYTLIHRADQTWHGLALTGIPPTFSNPPIFTLQRENQIPLIGIVEGYIKTDSIHRPTL